MKSLKYFLLMAVMMVMGLNAMADDDDRVITYNQLPQAAQDFLKQNYPGKVVLKLERRRMGYEVRINNGLEVEFNRNFQVIDVDYDD